MKNTVTTLAKVDIPVFFWLGEEAELLGLTEEEFNMEIRKESRDGKLRRGELPDTVDEQSGE